MSEKLMKCHVVLERPGIVKPFIRQGIAWGFLIAVVGGSRTWFGGAFVVDLAALVLFGAIVFAIGRKHLGYEVDVPRDEMRAWVDAGMPEKWPAGS